MKVYCGGENTGCDHEDNPTEEECSDCPYMATIRPKPPLLSFMKGVNKMGWIKTSIQDQVDYYVNIKGMTLEQAFTEINLITPVPLTEEIKDMCRRHIESKKHCNKELEDLQAMKDTSRIRD